MSDTSITQFIIEKLCEADEGARGLFPKRRGHFIKMLLELDPRRNVHLTTVSSILSRLKRQGLIERIGPKQDALWHITPSGRAWQKAHARSRDMHRSKTDGVTRLVIFDIPEFDRKKRTALRAELMRCDFRQLQKSVWIGNRPLPQDFIAFLDELHLHDKVYIFSVREHGTIRRAYP